MRGPLWILAGLTVVIGLRLAVAGPGDSHHAPVWLAGLSVALAVGGIALAWAVYQRNAIDPAVLGRAFGPIDFLARRRYGIDGLYAGLYRGFILGFSALIGWIDRYVVDGVLNVLSALSLGAGDRLRRIQSGQPQDYVYGVAFGVLFLIVAAQWWRR
jgi:NADH-quinone oxidoreductase subunit L